MNEWTVDDLRNIANDVARDVRARQQKPKANGHDREDTPLSDEDCDAEIKRLAALPFARYERARQETAKRLKVRASVLDKLVAAERSTPEDKQTQGKPLEIPTPEPWPDPVDGATLLLDLTQFFSDHAFLPQGASTALALWTLHTYAFEALTHSPRLHIKSITKGSGKTTVLDLLELVVCRPLSTAHATSSVLFRVIERARPCLLVDEADTFIRGAEEIRGILNAGHKRGGQVLRTVGDDYEPRAFSVFAPVAIAGIGDLPGTIADRSVIISMKKAMPDELPAAIDRETRMEAARLAASAMRWALDHPELVDATPDMGHLYNRAADNWRALFAIAEAAGGNWLALARLTAAALIVTDDDTETLGVKLLGDIRQLFTENEISSQELVERLLRLEGRPWAELNRGRPLTTNRLARLLKPFVIFPTDIGPENARLRGYRLERFADAFGRYLT